MVAKSIRKPLEYNCKSPRYSLVQKTKMDFKNADGGGGEMGRGDATVTAVNVVKVLPVSFPLWHHLRRHHLHKKMDIFKRGVWFYS